MNTGHFDHDADHPSQTLSSNPPYKVQNSSNIFYENDKNSDIEKLAVSTNACSNSVGSGEQSPEKGLKRALQPRHISMIAIGGALGTGLVIGTGGALVTAGPGAVFIAFCLVGVLGIYPVVCAIGEMAAWIPLSEGFSGYSSRFCDNSLAFGVGWVYFMKYIIVAPNQLTAAAMVLEYWVPREKVNPGVWIVIFLAFMIFLNMFGVKIFGEMEFILSSVKIITMLGLILVTLVIALGGGPDHDRRGFRYWHNPGAFKPYSKHGTTIEGSLGKFVSFVSVLVYAVFAFLSTELVGLTVGEAANPRKNIPKAIKLTFYRIVLFYLVSVLLLGMCVPYNDKGLAFAVNAGSGAAASPFVVAINNAKIKGLNHLINGCILVFVISGANSDIYIATRTLYGMAISGKAPRFIGNVNRFGIPYYALGISGAFGLIGLLNISDGSAKIFGYLVNVVSIMGLLAWICILITHIQFMKGMKAQGIPESELPYKAPFRNYASYVSLVFCTIIMLVKNFTAFVIKFDVKSFITGYIGIPVFLILVVGFKLIHKTKMIKPIDIDFYPPERAVIDAEEAEYIEAERIEAINNPPTRLQKVYEHTLGYIF